MAPCASRSIERLDTGGALNTPRRLTKFDLGQLALCRAAAPRIALTAGRTREAKGHYQPSFGSLRCDLR